jgi:hypothetical protein
MVVGCRAIGAACARDVGPPELTVDEVQRVSLRYFAANVEGSALVKAEHSVVGAHRDIHRREIATLILLAGGLRQGGPDGIWPPRLDPLALAWVPWGVQRKGAVNRAPSSTAPAPLRAQPIGWLHPETDYIASSPSLDGLPAQYARSTGGWWPQGIP